MTQEEIKVVKKTIFILRSLKRDAKWALKGKWAVDFQNEESLEGFECQINLINKQLPKLKKLIKTAKL